MKDSKKNNSFSINDDEEDVKKHKIIKSNEMEFKLLGCENV